jgi:trimeric autotransporter adhesin
LDLEPIRKNTRPRLALLLLVPLLLFSMTATSLASLPHAAGTTQAPGFSVLSVFWGTSTAKQSVGPGSVDVPLTVLLEYTYNQAGTTVNANLTLPSGFTDNNGNPFATAYLSGSVSPGAIVDFTFYLDVGANVSLGDYAVPLDLSWLVGQSGASSSSLNDLIQDTSIKVPVEGLVSLAFATVQKSLVPGELNNLTLVVENTGSGEARLVSVTASATSQGSVITQPSAISKIGPGSNATAVLGVFVPSSAAGSTLSLTFASTYLDPYNNTDSATSSLALLIGSAPKDTVSLSVAVVGQSIVPGVVNSVTAQVTNLGSGSATALSTAVSVSPSQDGTLLTQPKTIPVLEPNATTAETFSVYVPSSAAGTAISFTFTSSYTNSNNESETSTQSVGLITESSTSSTPTAAQISVTESGTPLTAGSTSEISLVIENEGSASLYSPTFTFSASSPLVVVANSSLSLPGVTLAPGRSITYSVAVGSSVSASGGLYEGTLGVTYLDASNGSHSESFSVGLQLTDPVTQLSVQAFSTNLMVGGSSAVSLEITNTGGDSLYYPSFSLSAPSSLTVTANSTYTRTGLVLAPGQSFEYRVTISNGPKTAEGAYGATLSVTYYDQYGNSHTLTFPVGLVVIGGIDLVVQDETVSQNATSITISGSLLNEGEASAYYLELVANATIGSQNVGGGSYYVGEIDPNTPTAFSITIPLSWRPTTGGSTSTITTSTATTSSPTTAATSSAPASSTTTSLSSTISSSTTATTTSSLTSRSFSGNFTGTRTGHGNFTFSFTQTTSSTSDPPSSSSSTADPASSTTSTSTSSTASAAPVVVDVTLSGNYQNDYGQAAQYSGPSKSLTLSTTGRVTTNPTTTSSSSENTTLTIARVALVAAIAVALVGSFLYLRRTRGSRAPSAPASGERDQVI